jgi:RNA polymerase sigma-70 factor (ECF subfamily)
MHFFKKNYKKSTEAELMQLLKSGDEAAFEELYNRYSQKMLKFFLRMLANDHDKARDFNQDLFMKIIENPFQYDVNRNFDTWIFSLAYNMCKNEYKKIKIRQAYQFDEQNKQDTSVLMKDTIDNEIYRLQLQKHLDQLSDEHKTIIILRFNEELSVKEIAEIVNCPEGTVKSRIFYTLQALSRKLAVFNPLNN